MKVTKDQIELIELNLDMNEANFNIKGYDYSFNIEFEYETEESESELDYFNGTGYLGGIDITFIDVTYISMLYTEDDCLMISPDVDKEDLEEILIQKIEYNLND